MGPVATPLTTTGVGLAEQDTASVQPVGGTLSLVDAGVDVTYIATDGGYYYVSGDHLQFYPQTGFSGTAPSVSYTITDSDLNSSTSTYTATVIKPAPPTASPLSSTGSEGHYYQYANTSGIDGNPDAVLVSGGTQVASLLVAGKGTYHANGGDGVTLAFQPIDCFVGTVPTVTYRLIDQYAQHADSTYTAHVTNPSPPTVSPLTSSGVGSATQTATAPQPGCVGSTKLLNGTGQPVTRLSRSDGVYTVDPATGVISFVPAPGYSGTGSAVSYRVVDQYGQSANSTYTTTVTPPPPPTSSPLTSTGVGPATQHGTAVVPVYGHAMLLNGVTPVMSLTVDGQGSYAVNTTSGVITFTPEPSYLGVATPVSYTVTDSYDQSATSTYTATVTEPAAPNPAAMTSTGVGTAVQSRTVAIPQDGAATLLDGGTPVTLLTVAGQGTYALDPATGAIRFTPVSGYLGSATPANYQVTDSYGQTGSATYTPTVTIPARPAAATLRSTGTAGTTQRRTVTIPRGDTVTLVNGSVSVATVTNPGQGTYALDAVTGVITFTPLAGYSGKPTPVTYQLNDAYGQFVRATYTPVVTAAALVTASPTTSTTTPSTSSPTPAADGALSATGSDVDQLIESSVLLVLLGAGLTAASLYRRRRPRRNRLT